MSKKEGNFLKTTAGDRSKQTAAIKVKLGDAVPSPIQYL
jgi:hypothetical protein